MKTFETRTYSISDFIEWQKAGLLRISPEFQRRSVWKQSAKSYLMDTIVRGKPIPKIIITQEIEKSRNIRTVVDGQQRLNAIFEFIDDVYMISKAHNPELARIHFSQMPEELKRDFYKFNIGCDILFDIPYEEKLDIFTRLNAYTVPLVLQEKLNAKYVGYFKQAAYRLGHRYAKYWLSGGVLSTSQISRMGEADLASDLIIMLLDRIQSGKVLEKFYRDYEEKDAGLTTVEKRFDRVMSFIGQVYPADSLSSSIYKKAPLFYSLFSAIAHGLYNLKGLDIKLRPNIGERSVSRVRAILDEISVQMEVGVASPHLRIRELVEHSRRRTADAKSREIRGNALSAILKQNLG